MAHQNLNLSIGDEIGFVILSNDVDKNDEVVFFPVAEIIEVAGETAYRYQYPDGEISHGFVRASELTSRFVKIHTVPAGVPEPVETDRKICIAERKDEFVAALNRGKNSTLEVYADFEFDQFVVVNKDNKKEYRVTLETRDGKLFGDCECPDFFFKKRVCKHISEVLTDALFSVKI